MGRLTRPSKPVKEDHVLQTICQGEGMAVGQVLAESMGGDWNLTHGSVC